METKENIRIGIGFDIHRLETGHPLILGGITIPSEKGAIGHSDADCLLHAVTDALLGALAKGDIGTHFPDTDPSYHGRDSSFFLKEVYRSILEEGYSLNNLDATIILERPKLMEYIPKIRRSLASFLSVSQNQISVKAKTHERLDAVGLGEGISTHVVVLLRRA